MDSTSTNLVKIINKLDLIDKNIDNNKWDKLSEHFAEIKVLRDSFNNQTSVEFENQKNKIITRIDSIEKKIISWKEEQKHKIENLKRKENHINGYKKQPNRAYYIDKSE